MTKTILKTLILTTVLLFGMMSAFAIDDEDIITISPEIKTKEPIGLKGALIQNDYLTGSWHGLREKLKKRGFDIQSSYTMTTIQSIPNSKAEKADNSRHSHGNYKGLYNLSAEIDTEKANLWKGGKFFILYQTANKGYSPNNSLGSFLTTDATDTGNNSIHQLSEYWYEQEFADKFSLKIGKQDANCDFQNIDGGFEYVNLSFSYVPTTPIPFYPAGQMGARLKYDINDTISLQNGFYSGATSFGSGAKDFFSGDSGYFNITEIDITPEINSHSGKYLLGGWIHTKDIEKISNNNLEDNNYGFYAMAEQNLYKEKNSDTQGLNLILQGGWTPKDRNEVNKYYGLGLLYKGLIPKRDDDVIGLGAGVAGFSDYANTDKKSENIFEVFYKFQITKWLSIQPDIQYIMHPMGTDGSGFAFGVRTNIVF